MANAHYFYLPLTVADLEKKVRTHQQEFDEYLNETFSETELNQFERELDSIAAVFVQPIFSEMSFDDFYANPDEEDGQRFFFDACKSSICLENLPDFHSNPFQITWLLQLLELFDDVLIDQGGVEELEFKAHYVEKLKKYKSVDSMISSPLEKPIEVKTTKPVFPIDFLILDVYREIDRLKSNQQIYRAIESIESLPEKTQKIFKVVMNERLDSTSLLKKCGLNPKDFGDYLEKLKFFLKRI